MSADASADLAGRTVVVAGAAGGIGGACARLAARLGADVFLTDIAAGPVGAVADELTRDGWSAVAVAADLTRSSAAELVVGRAMDTFGRVDGLVSAAGLYRMSAAAAQDLDEARAIIDANVVGAINIGVHAARVMVPGSSIVNFTSGAEWGMASMAVYGASKGAIAALTYSWAIDLAAAGIRVNAVSPTAATGMSDALFDHLGLAEPERAARRRAMPDPANVAPLVAYLLSAGSDGISGQVVRIDGRALSIVTHPAILQPVCEDDGWTLEKVRAVFDDDLRHRLQPVGGGTQGDRPTQATEGAHDA